MLSRAFLHWHIKPIYFFLHQNENLEDNDKFTHDFTDQLLSLWTTVVSEQCLPSRFSSNSNNKSTSSRGGGSAQNQRSSDQTHQSHRPQATIPLRLLQTKLNSGQQSDNGAIHQKQWEAVVTAASPSPTYTTDLLLCWLAASLSLLRGMWVSNFGPVSLRQQWLSQGQVDSLLAAAVDVLEHVIIPDATLYAHPITLEIIAWFHTLATAPPHRRGSASLPHPQTLRLLRTQQATTRTTAELWHFAPTATAVAVKLFHRVVVIEQNQHLPVPKARAARFNTIRDQLVRFFHALWQAVQEDRRQWEREQQRPETNNKNQRSPISFLMLLSECQEWYTSAAALLLAIPSDLDTSKTSSPLYYNPCRMHPDLLAMIKMQMDELAEDQMEKLGMD